MVKEFVFIMGGVVVAGVVIYAIIRYRKSQREMGFEIERIYSDELNIPEVKKWFADKLDSDHYQGILLYPSSENVKKWNIRVPEEDTNVLIQVVYDKEKDTVIQYREVIFETLSDKLSQLLDENDGCLVIEK